MLHIQHTNNWFLVFICDSNAFPLLDSVKSDYNVREYFQPLVWQSGVRVSLDTGKMQF